MAMNFQIGDMFRVDSKVQEFVIVEIMEDTVFGTDADGNEEEFKIDEIEKTS